MSTTGGTRGPTSAPELPERLQRLLSVLVREYIDHGEPVSSQWLAEHAGYPVSSATVRNILSRLEELGFVRQPHTSAGRMPTDLGYRHYVDSLLQARRLARLSPELEARLRRAGATSASDVFAHVSHELSRVSHYLGFALAPPREDRLTRIDFVLVDGSRVMVVVQGSSGDITHKLIAYPEPVTREELIEASNYLSAEFAGLTLAEARAQVLERMHQHRVLYDALLSRALRLAGMTLEQIATNPDDAVFVSGMQTLLEDGLADDGVPLATLRAILSMIEEKHRLVSLLTAYMEQPGLTVVIGNEHTTPDLRNFSLIAATYTDGQRTGTLGIIGPTRMRYSRAIAAVDGVSQAVSRILADGSNN
jgi:heat-inducible transcriptional repressor